MPSMMGQRWTGPPPWHWQCSLTRLSFTVSRFDPLLDVGHLGKRLGTDLGAVGVRIFLQREELLDLPQGKAQLLRPLDKAQHPDLLPRE
jgi:hypothetical protein